MVESNALPGIRRDTFYILFLFRGWIKCTFWYSKRHFLYSVPFFVVGTNAHFLVFKEKRICKLRHALRVLGLRTLISLFHRNQKLGNGWFRGSWLQVTGLHSWTWELRRIIPFSLHNFGARFLCCMIFQEHQSSSRLNTYFLASESRPSPLHLRARKSHPVLVIVSGQDSLVTWFSGSTQVLQDWPLTLRFSDVGEEYAEIPCLFSSLLFHICNFVCFSISYIILCHLSLFSSFRSSSTLSFHFPLLLLLAWLGALW